MKCARHNVEFDPLEGEGCPQCIDELWHDATDPPNDEMEDGLNSEVLTLAKPNIVKVQYYSETTGELSLREYTYYSADKLNVGDIVIVPVRDTTGKAKVSAIDVPEAEIAAFKDKVKTIPAGSIRPSPATEAPEVELPVGGLAEAARAAGAEVHAVAFENMAVNLGIMPKPEINLCDTCSKRKDYPMCCSPDIIFGDGVGNDNIIKCSNYDNGEAKPCTIPLTVVITPEPETALALRPGADIEAMNWHAEALKALAYANDRKVTNADEYALASDDLSIVSKLKKLMIARRKELLDPLKAESDAIRETYTFLMEPVDKADQITRAKMTAYLSEQARIKAEQERINQLRMEAAQKEAALSGTGEITESVNLIPVQMDTPKSIKTALGSSGLTDHWTYEIIDISLIPREYMMPDTVLLGNTAKKYHDTKPVDGVRFINKPFMSNRAR